MTGWDLAIVLSVALVAAFFGSCVKNRMSPKQVVMDFYHLARAYTIFNRQKREAYIRDLDSKS